MSTYTKKNTLRRMKGKSYRKILKAAQKMCYDVDSLSGRIASLIEKLEQHAKIGVICIFGEKEHLHETRTFLIRMAKRILLSIFKVGITNNDVKMIYRKEDSEENETTKPIVLHLSSISVYRKILARVKFLKLEFSRLKAITDYDVREDLIPERRRLYVSAWRIFGRMRALTDGGQIIIIKGTNFVTIYSKIQLMDLASEEFTRTNVPTEEEDSETADEDSERCNEE